MPRIVARMILHNTSREIGNARVGAGRAMGFALAAMLLLLDIAVAGPRIPVGQWRTAVERDRILAENDVPRAHAEALRLLAALPVDASPADRARALNLLARTEAYLGLTLQADTHARQAMQLEIGRAHV